MITFGVMVGGLLLSAWLGFLAAVGMMLIERDIMTSPSAVLLLAVGGNLLLALLLRWAIRRERPHLQFPATVRSLTPPEPEKSSRIGTRCLYSIQHTTQIPTRTLWTQP